MGRLWILLLLVAANADGVSESVTLRFRPAGGSTATLTYERVLQLALDNNEQTVTFDGEDQGGEELPDIELTVTETESTTFTDSYEVEDGELKGLSRNFDLISNVYESRMVDPDGEEFSEESLGISELEEATVLFRWDAESEVFHASFGEDSDGLDEELLEGLEASANLSEYLPSRPVEVGDRWEPEIDAFIRMSNLSGDLKVIPEGEEEDAEDDFAGQFDDHLEGEIEAELLELRAVEGGRLAVIGLKLDLSTRVENETELDTDEATGVQNEEHVFAFVLEGELHWSLQDGLARSLELKGDVTLVTRITAEHRFNGHEMKVEELQEFSGTLAIQATVE